MQFDDESETDFQNRINLETAQRVANSKGNHILIVSHGAVIAQFYKQWDSYSSVRRQNRIPNCAIFKYLYVNQTFILQEIIEHVIYNLGI